MKYVGQLLFFKCNFLRTIDAANYSLRKSINLEDILILIL